MPVLKADVLQSFMARVFIALGTPEAGAKRVAESLVRSNLVGHDSHGAIRIPQYVRFVREGRIDPKAVPVVEHETATTALVNGNWCWGPIAAGAAAAKAIELAERYQIGAVALHQSTHIGRVGQYAEDIAARGMVAIITANNHGGAPQVAPFGGRERRLSSNPIAFAAPTSGDPLLVDITSAVVAEGKVRMLRNQGKLAPEGWLLDAQGHPTRDPDVLYQSPPGALLPLGGALGHKGYGLSVLVEVFSGALSGAGCSSLAATRIGNAVYIQALRVDSFVPAEVYYREVDGLVQSLKSCKPAEGFEEVLLPGEPERRTERQRREQGISIDEETWHQICESAKSLGLPVPGEEPIA